jgi:alkyl hydroperoxide reductase subunit AhpC
VYGVLNAEDGSALRTGELCPVSWQPGQPTLRIVA